MPNGWINANISCNPPANTIADLTKNQIVINVTSGANVTCTFVTQRAGRIIAGKYNDRNHNHLRKGNDSWLIGWQMQIYSGPGSLVGTESTNAAGRATFTNLRPGNYTVCETPQAGWFNITPSQLMPGFNQPCYAVTVEAAKAVWARFGNSTTTATTAAATIAAAVDEFTDLIICDLPPTDDEGVEIADERDPWEEEEAAGNDTIFLPLIQR